MQRLLQCCDHRSRQQRRICAPRHRRPGNCECEHRCIQDLVSCMSFTMRARVADSTVEDGAGGVSSIALLITLVVLLMLGCCHWLGCLWW